MWLGAERLALRVVANAEVPDRRILAVKLTAALRGTDAPPELRRLLPRLERVGR